MTADIQLIATDLDGTLIGGASEFPFYSKFNELMRELWETNGTRWAACTGRTFRSYRSFFTPMRMVGMRPDYVVIRHAYIYRHTSFGYLPHALWNINTLYELWRERVEVARAIDSWHEMIAGGSLGVRTVRRSNDRLCLRFDSEKSAVVAGDLLREKTKPYRHVHVFSYLMEVDVRIVPFTKGLAVSELARHLGIPREKVLAMGNGHNDISMLNGRVSGMTGCPAGSEPEVMEAVHKSGGHVAKSRSLKGVMEILDAYRTGRVDSSLPAGWEVSNNHRNPRTTKQTQRISSSKRRLVRPPVFVAILYAVLLVFASYDAIPFAAAIRKPYELVVSLVLKIIFFF